MGMAKLCELLEAEKTMIPDSNDDYYIGYNNGLAMAQAIVLKQDVEEVVRCKDCKYQIKEWHPDNRMISKGYYTYGCDRNFHRYSSNAVNGMDNDFCSYGERREGE